MAISDALMVAVTCVELTKLVVRAEPFHNTVVPFTKFIPFTVKVNAGPPTPALFGESEVRPGTGLSIVNVAGFETELPGFTTVTGIVPPVRRSSAGTCAVI